jgi:membrane protein YqaA with SNARE-associated domain
MNLAAICVTTFGGCLLGSLVPLVNTELLLLSMSALAPAGSLAAIVGFGAVGQVAGKVLLYLAGRGTFHRLKLREQPRLKSVIARLEKSPRTSGLVLFSSASAGLPPLYAMSVASGMIGLPLSRFIVIGLAGRILRFALLVQVPHLFTGIAR